MGGILSAISGQFTRSLILGAFFPVVLFLVLGLLTVQPLLPEGIPIVHVLQAFDRQWQALAMTFLAIVLAGMLYNLNTPIVRLYEGYPWRSSFIGQWWMRRFRRDLEKASRLIPRMRMVRNGLREFSECTGTVIKLQSQMDPIGVRLSAAFPSEAEFVLPTRFGNVIRSFETYPGRQYGMDGVALWPRLAVTAPKEVMEATADARSTVDFFINCSLLSAVLAVSILALGLWKTSDRVPPSTLIGWPIEACVAGLCSYAFYQGATARASAWGGLVRTAFDLYRQDLLKKLGYEDTPKNRAEERALWTAISQQIIYGDPPFDAPREYGLRPAARTVITTIPVGVPVEVSGGINSGMYAFGADPFRTVRHTYVVRHASSGGLNASAVSLTESLPPDEMYVWNSGRVNNTLKNPTGTNPLVFNLGPLRDGETIEIAYVSLKSRGES